MKQRVIAIVPAFNEGQNIRSVVEDIRVYCPGAEILVINDCSSDDTVDIVRQAGERVISLPINLGIGGAVQTGLRFALDNQFDIAVQVDGDGQHSASEICRVIAPIIEDNSDVVIGSRFLGTISYKGSSSRRIGMRIFEFLNSLLIGQRITDNTSGFRAYNREAIRFLAQFYPQDYPEPEAVVELYRNGFRIVEVPVVMNERKRGASSIRTLNSIYYMVKVLMAILIAFSRTPVKGEKG